MSKEKVQAERDKQAAEGTEETIKQFTIRGYKTVESAAVAKYLADEKIDLTNRDSHNKQILFKVGRALGADFVAFSVINDVGQRSNISLLTTQKEGRAQLTVWVVNTKSEKAILDGISQEGKSARGAGAIFQSGSPRIVTAVGNAIKAVLIEPLGPIPADKK